MALAHRSVRARPDTRFAAGMAAVATVAALGALVGVLGTGHSHSRAD